MDVKKIGNRLLVLRGERSRREVAQNLGIAVSSLQMYECGHRIPRDEIKIALAKYYSESIERLFFSD